MYHLSVNVRIVPPTGDSEDGDRPSRDDGPARLGRKGDIDRSESVDVSEYPLVDIHVNVDTEDTSELDEEHFTVYQEGERTPIRDFDFRASALDLVFVFDDTGSMYDEIDGAKRGVTKLTTAIADRGIDARYGLVSFKDAPEVDQGLTSDPTELKSAVNDLEASAGGDAPEANYDAIETALGLDLRDEATTVFVDITDASSHYQGDGSGFSDYTREEVAADLNRRDVTFVAVAPDEFGSADGPGSVKGLAGDAGGLWTDIDEEEFDWVLDRIIALLVGTYVLTVHTCTPPGEDWSVTVEFDHPRFGSGSDSSFISVPSHETLPPECEDDELTAGTAVDERPEDRVRDRDRAAVDERPEDRIRDHDRGAVKERSDDDSGTESDEGTSEDATPLVMEIDDEEPPVGAPVSVTVRGPSGRIEGAVLEARERRAETSSRGTATLRFDEPGPVELRVDSSDPAHAPNAKTLTVGGAAPTEDDESVDDEVTEADATTDDGVTREDAEAGDDAATGGDDEDEADLTPVVLEPSSGTVDVGSDVSVTVRDRTGSRVANATLETDRGHTAVTDSRGECQFEFDRSGEVTVELVDTESGAHESATTRIDVV